MKDFLERGDKIFGYVTKFSLLIGGILSLINSMVYSHTDWEGIAWCTSGLFALSGFAQILKLESKIKEDENDFPG